MITNAKIVTINAHPSDYLRDTGERGTPEFTMSASAMRNFAVCPSRWMKGYKSPESKSKEWGTLIDCLALTPELLDDRFALQPETYRDSKNVLKPWHNGSNTCKAWTAEQKSAGLEIVNQEKLDAGKAAVKRLMDDDVISDFIESSDKQVWVSFVWKDKATGLEINCRCLLDLVPRKDTELYKVLGDLKTVTNASRRIFGRQVFTYGWHIQASLYMDAYVAATGEDRCEFSLLCQENYEPYETARRILSESYLELGRTTYRRIMADYCRCVSTGKFPSYDDQPDAVQGFSIVEPEPWMLDQNERFDFGSDEPIEDDLPEPATDVGH